MRGRSRWAGFLAAGLLLTGCTTAVTGLPQPGGTAPSPSTGTSNAESASSLDPATAHWFATFCDAAADVAQYVSPDTTGQTLAQAQATIVAAYTNIAASASSSVALLRATQVPPIPGGADLQANAISSLRAVADVYGRGAQTVSALSPTGVPDLTSAVDAIEAEASASVPSTMTNVDPDLVAAARKLPECRSVLGG